MSTVSNPTESLDLLYSTNIFLDLIKYASHATTYFKGVVANITTRAFAAKASAKAIDAVQIWGQKWSALVEEDEVVRANNQKRSSRFFRN
jgi:hypothetical protein